MSTHQQQLEDLDREGWARIVSRAKDAERDLDDIAAEIVETSEEQMMYKDDRGNARNWTQEQRLQKAMTIVTSRLVVAGATIPDRYILHVLEVLPPRSFQSARGLKKLGALYGIAAKVTVDEKTNTENIAPAQFAHVQFWDDVADKVNDAQPGKTYDTKLNGSFKEGHLQLKGVPKTKWDKSIPDAAIDPLAILRASFREVALADLEQYAASKAPILVRGNVTFSRTGRAKTGKDYGLMTIWDKSQKEGERGITAFVDPVQVRYGLGSDLWVLATVSKGGKNAETGEQYQSGLNALAIISEFTVPPPANEKKAGPAADSKTIGTNEPAVDFAAFQVQLGGKKEETAAPVGSPAQG